MNYEMNLALGSRFLFVYLLFLFSCHLFKRAQPSLSAAPFVARSPTPRSCESLRRRSSPEISATSETREITADESGVFRFLELPAGNTKFPPWRRVSGSARAQGCGRMLVRNTVVNRAWQRSSEKQEAIVVTEASRSSKLPTPRCRRSSIANSCKNFRSTAAISANSLPSLPVLL